MGKTTLMRKGRGKWDPDGCDEGSKEERESELATREHGRE